MRLNFTRQVAAQSRAKVNHATWQNRVSKITKRFNVLAVSYGIILYWVTGNGCCNNIVASTVKLHAKCYFDLTGNAVRMDWNR